MALTIGVILAGVIVVGVTILVLRWMRRRDHAHPGGHEAFTSSDAASATTSAAADLVDHAAPVPPKDAPIEQETTLDEYAARMYVLRVFNAVLRRRPTSEELERYAALKQETAIMKAIVRDMRIVQEEAYDDEMCESDEDAEDDDSASVVMDDEDDEDACGCDSDDIDGSDGEDVVDDDGGSTPEPSSRHLPVLADIDPHAPAPAVLPPPPRVPGPPPRRRPVGARTAGDAASLAQKPLINVFIVALQHTAEHT